MEYQIHNRNNNQNGFLFTENWKLFLTSLSSKINFIDDDEYNFRYLDEGKIGISLEDNYIQVWFEEENFEEKRCEEIVREFCNTLSIPRSR